MNRTVTFLPDIRAGMRSRLFPQDGLNEALRIGYGAGRNTLHPVGHVYTETEVAQFLAESQAAMDEALGRLEDAEAERDEALKTVERLLAERDVRLRVAV